MSYQEPITKIMAKNPRAITESTRISEAAQLFAELKIHHLPVVSDGKLVGMFSYGDLLSLDFSAPFNQDARQVFAVLDSEKSMKEVMSTELTTLKDSDTVKDAAIKLSEGNFHSVPVVDEQSALVGIVTSTDLIRYLANLF